jgi:hypothetical protein
MTLLFITVGTPKMALCKPPVLSAKRWTDTEMNTPLHPGACAVSVS